MSDDTLLERLARMEAKQDIILSGHNACRAEVSMLSEKTVANEASAKSAHKRIDAMQDAFNKYQDRQLAVLGVSVTAVGIFATTLTWALGR